MCKLTIYHGRATPLVAIGKHQARLLGFAFKYQGWHSINTKDRNAMRAMQALQRKGFLYVENDQFRVRLDHA